MDEAVRPGPELAAIIRRELPAAAARHAEGVDRADFRQLVVVQKFCRDDRQCGAEAVSGDV